MIANEPFRVYESATYKIIFFQQFMKEKGIRKDLWH